MVYRLKFTIGLGMFGLLVVAVALATTPFSYSPSEHDIPADKQCVKGRAECPWRGACEQYGGKCVSCQEGAKFQAGLGCYTCPEGKSLKQVNGQWSCE